MLQFDGSHVALDGIVVACLQLDSILAVSNPDDDDGILRAIKNATRLHSKEK
jgi:hypothetical protein